MISQEIEDFFLVLLQVVVAGLIVVQYIMFCIKNSEIILMCQLESF